MDPGGKEPLGPLRHPRQTPQKYTAPWDYRSVPMVFRRCNRNLFLRGAPCFHMPSCLHRIRIHKYRTATGNLDQRATAFFATLAVISIPLFWIYLVYTTFKDFHGFCSVT